MALAFLLITFPFATVAVTPEPGSILLLGGGAAALILLARKRKNRK